MMAKQRRRLGVLLIGLLLLALPAGSIDVHSHPDGTSKTCTLCQAPHLPGSLATVSGVSRPIARNDRPLPRPAILVADTIASTLGSRGPPALSPSS